MLAVLHSIGMFVVDWFKSPRRLEVENLFLRHQLNIALRRAPHRLRLRGSDRAILARQRSSAEAAIAQAIAQRDQAEVNLTRTQIRSPVNGWVTNLLAQLGDYATVGRSVISVVDADSFWVDAYFEETQPASIHEGDPAKIKLMGCSEIVVGEVGSVARGINVANAQSGQQGLATVNPIFTSVRLLNACRCASGSIRYLMAFAWSPA
jgi:multidrug resistance efflux pump